MTVHNLLSVKFTATTYAKSRKGFSFPTELMDAFGFQPHDRVELHIETPKGQTIFDGETKFISGPEITAADACSNLDFSQDIVVTASRPK